MQFQVIFEQLKSHQNAALARQMAAYMRNQFCFLGIPKPLRERICKPYFAAEKNQPIDWHFIEACWAAEYRELQYVAADYLRLHKTLLTPTDIPRLRVLIENKSWWDSVDHLDQTVGEITFRYPEVKAVLLDWSKNENIWLRRTAIQHQLLRKEKTDTALLEQILVHNLAQTEFFINKAIGWALRDFSKTNPDWVRHFIQQYQDKMATLSIREASKYL